MNAAKTRTTTDIVSYMSVQQMAEEIVRLDAVIAGQPNITMGRLPAEFVGMSDDDEPMARLSRGGAVMTDWLPIESAPIDEWILIAATPDHVWQAVVYDDADINGNGSDARRYEWAFGSAFHPDHKPTHWMPMPTHPEARAIVKATQS